MTIECKICKKVMAKQITNTHLKSHNMTTAEYKVLYGDDSLTSDDYRKFLSASKTGENNSNFGKKWSDSQKQVMSEKKIGTTPWNKGMKVGSSDNHKAGIQLREEKYKSGEIVRSKRHMTDDLRHVLSEKQAQFMLDNPEEGKKRAKKAIETKIKNGFDFGKPMRGKSHSQATKEKISIKSKETNSLRSELAFKNRLEKIHSANLELIDVNEQVLNLRCKQCNGVFSLTSQCFTESKFRNNWCQTCYPTTKAYRSKAEIELHDFIRTLSTDAIHSNRQLLKKKELDVYVPSKKIAIEFNGLYWHSEAILNYNGKSKHSDYHKMIESKQAGIRYIGIFEDEWVYKNDIVKSRLKNILNCTPNIIYARKCEIKAISSKEASSFCNKNHIQGSGRSNVRLGLFFNGTLISVMTFSKSNISRKITNWEINRFCTVLDTTVVGGASKLFSKFLKEYDPQEVVSYADSRWSEGSLYKALNFEFVKQTTPNYWYFLPNDLHRIHRFTLRKKSGEPDSITESELRESQGYMKIWDCGSTKWIWKKGP